MYQRQYQKISPQTTAHLAQTMTLLNMTVEELRQEIERALNENPALVKEEKLFCPNCRHPLSEGQICPICSKPKEISSDEAVVFISPRGDFHPSKPSSQEDMFADEILGSESMSLEEYVLSQIITELEDDEKIPAAYILNQLDEDGFFKENRTEVSSYYHISLEKTDRILNLIHRADPLGVGTSSPEEAIRVQLKILSENGTIPGYFLEIADTDLEQILRKQFRNIAKKHGLSIEKVEEVSEFFSNNLNPFPARAHWGTFRQPTDEDSRSYTNPDVIISYINDDPEMPLIVEVIVPSYSNLNISPIYQKAMNETDKETKEKLKNDFDKANLFIKCIQQRNNTMQRLMEQIIKIQKPFIKKGDEFIKPITRVKISKNLDVHESTISRAVSSKTVQMPDKRIIPLATFFDRSLGVRAVLKEIIESEDRNNPYSDSELVSELKKRGHKIARRTVAKYRSMEGILAAHQRKKL